MAVSSSDTRSKSSRCRPARFRASLPVIGISTADSCMGALLDHLAVEGEQAAVDACEEVVHLLGRGNAELLLPVKEGKRPEELKVVDVEDQEDLLQGVELGQLLAALVLGELALADAGQAGNFHLGRSAQLPDPRERQPEIDEHAGGVCRLSTLHAERRYGPFEER